MNQREQFEKWWMDADPFGDRDIELAWQAWQAAQAAAVPEGWQVVPRKSTETMNRRGQGTVYTLASTGMHWHDIYGQCYASMLAAAPKPEDGK